VAKRILIVDDNPVTLDLLTLLLDGEGFDTIQANNGQDALEKVRLEFPDLVILDVTLSGMDGYDVCNELKKSNFTKQIPLIIITSDTSLPGKSEVANLPSDEIIAKPYRNQELLARISNLFHIKQLEEDLLISSKELLTIRRALKTTTGELDKTRQDTIYSLLVAMETRDRYTSGHAKNVSSMCVSVAKTMHFDARSLEHLEYASILHDVGKIGVPYNILMKPGKLTTEEEEKMRKHPIISADIIRPIGFLERIIPIILHHHESVDGSGYPDRLRGDQIPLESRIIAVVDAYHAMVSDRPYRQAMPVERAFDILKSASGTQFDPDILNIFLSIMQSQPVDVIEQVNVIEPVA
jgi:putative two-component system response regulator